MRTLPPWESVRLGAFSHQAEAPSCGRQWLPSSFVILSIEEAAMSQSVETSVDDGPPNAGALTEGETIQERLIREEAEEEKFAYSPTMSDAEIEAFIALLHRHADEWAKEQHEPTDSVKMLREMRVARSEELYQRSRNADRD
jgi:hypothetical protein